MNEKVLCVHDVIGSVVFEMLNNSGGKASDKTINRMKLTGPHSKLVLDGGLGGGGMWRGDTKLYRHNS